MSPDINAIVQMAEAYTFHAARMREAPQRFQPPVLGRLRLGRVIETTAYIERRRQLDQMRRSAAGLFAHLNLLVTPTITRLPLPDTPEAKDDDAGVALFARNTRPFNASVARSIDTLRLCEERLADGSANHAVPPWGEESVLRLAHVFEQATDWWTRRPAL